jgi:hypothetical protein
MKKKKKVALAPQLSKENAEKIYIIDAARKLSIYKCWINNDWGDRNISVVCVARIRPNGSLVVGVYMVDAYCLGVKNTFAYLSPGVEELEHEVNTKVFIGFDAGFSEADPNFVQNFVWGAVEFAEDCGLEPHRDFEVAQYVLDPADEIEYMEIEFGKGGRPLFRNGPYDDTDKILAKLTAKLGEGNFDCIIHLGAFDDSFDEDEEE